MERENIEVFVTKIMIRKLLIGVIAAFHVGLIFLVMWLTSVAAFDQDEFNITLAIICPLFFFLLVALGVETLNDTKPSVSQRDKEKPSAFGVVFAVFMIVAWIGSAIWWIFQCANNEILFGEFVQNYMATESIFGGYLGWFVISFARR